MKLLPDLAELLALRGDALGVRLHDRAVARAPTQGVHRSAQRGRGLEFEEVRPYVAGDDARNIDWRVTARRGRPHTKLYREERERPVWLLADLHAGLYFGSRRQLKSALLLRAAAFLAWRAVQGGDRFGAVIATGSQPPQVWPARGRDAGVLPVLQALIDAQPRGPAANPQSGLTAGLATMLTLARQGHQVIVVSDFSGLDEASESALAALAQRASCTLLWLCDPLERDGLPDGAYRVGLPGMLRWLDGHGSRDDWRAAWDQRVQRLSKLSQRLNLRLIKLDTSDDLIMALPAQLRGWS